MNKLLAILFLATLLVLTQNKYATIAIASSDTVPTVNQNSTHIEKDEDQDKIELAHEDKEDSHDEDENDDDEDSGGRVISIIPSSSNSALLKRTLTASTLPTATPTKTEKHILGNTTRSVNETVSPTPVQETEINMDQSKNDTASASFDLIKELQKLLSSLQKIIFTTIS